jgi:hypothetical protein
MIKDYYQEKLIHATFSSSLPLDSNERPVASSSNSIVPEWSASKTSNNLLYDYNIKNINNYLEYFIDSSAFIVLYSHKLTKN